MFFQINDIGLNANNISIERNIEDMFCVISIFTDITEETKHIKQYEQQICNFYLNQEKIIENIFIDTIYLVDEDNKIVIFGKE